MNSDQLREFYSNVSFAGLLAIYALKLSFDKKKAFDRIDFANKIGIMPADYLYGFIIACSALNILNFNTTNNVITTTSILDILSNSIEVEINKMAKRYPLWETALEKTKKYFE